MTLPDGFSEFEHLQSLVKQVHNREVRDAFSDLGGEEWLPDISTPRASLRHGCTIKDDDNIATINMRMWLYFLHLRRAKDLQPTIIGNIVGNFDPQRKYRPQLGFYFKEDEGDVEDGYDPVEGTITFRLMSETTETLTKARLRTIAQKIKTEFDVSNGFIWRKGKDLASYVDKKNGFQFQLLVRNKTDAKELIGKLLDCVAKTPNWKYLSYKESDEPTSTFPTIPSNQTILGEVYKEPRRRPIASVRFQYAYCKVWGRPTPVILFDRSFAHLNALVD